MAYDVGSLLVRFEEAGVFEFVFPFLLIFALVFGILQKIGLFGAEDKGKPLNLVISVVIAFMAIRMEFVRIIFGEITARASVGILILIMMLILISMFFGDDANSKKRWYVGFSVVAAIIFVIILMQSFQNFGGYDLGSYLSGDLIGWIVGVILVGGVIYLVARK